MKDFLLNEINVDDVVLIIEPGYRSLLLATVIALTPKKVRVEFKRPGYKERDQVLQDPQQLVVVNQLDLTAYLLKKG